ncbi:MAG: PKD domain-containing protein [Chloroflexi bacterium]|nr:PKD domain-containing protein [Chloroflexota bacterium]
MSTCFILGTLALAVAAGVACGAPPPTPATTPTPELALAAIETPTTALTPTSTLIQTVTPTPTPTPLPTSTPTPTPVPPLASYTVDVESGSAPLTVEFDNASEGPIASVEWDFGDGATSSDGSPSHRYTIAGTYSVKLAVSGPGGTDTRSVSDLITVLPGPAASLEVSPSTATLTVQHAVEFSALVRDEFGNVVDDAVVWATTADSGSIDENGLFSAGTVSGAFANSIMASLRTDTGEQTDWASVTVEPGPPSEAVVEPGEISLESGGSQDFRVEVFDEFGNGITDALVPTINKQR